MGAPTAIHEADHQDKAENSPGAVALFGRRVSEFARRTSLSAMSIVRNNREGIRAKIRGTFFGDDSIRHIPDSVETNRALASMSILQSKSVDFSRQSVALFNNSGTEHDVESGVSRSNRSNRLKHPSLPGTFLSSRNVAVAPSIGGSFRDPLETHNPDYCQLRSDMEEVVNTLPESTERVVFVSEWG